MAPHNIGSQAKNVMSRGLITLPLTATMQEAHEVMDARRIRHLPLTDDQGSIVGILSDRDVARAMRGAPADYKSHSPAPIFNPSHHAMHYMSWPVKAVDRETSLKEVVALMLNEKISALLVEDHKVPLGILTTEDLMKYLLQLLSKDPNAISLKLGHAGIEIQAMGYEN